MLEPIENIHDPRIPSWVSRQFPHVGGHLFAEFDADVLQHLWRGYEFITEIHHIYDSKKQNAKFAVVSDNLKLAIGNVNRVSNHSVIRADENRIYIEAWDGESVGYSQFIGGLVTTNGQVSIETQAIKKWLGGVGTARLDFERNQFSAKDLVFDVYNQYLVEDIGHLFDLENSEYRVTLTARQLWDVHQNTEKYCEKSVFNGSEYAHFTAENGKLRYIVAHNHAHYEAGLSLGVDDLKDNTFMIHRKAIKACIMALKNGKHFKFEAITIHVFPDGRVVLETGYESILVVSLSVTASPLIEKTRSQWDSVTGEEFRPSNEMPSDRYNKKDECVLNTNGAFVSKPEGHNGVSYYRKHIPDDMCNYATWLQGHFLFIKTKSGEKAIIASIKNR